MIVICIPIYCILHNILFCNPVLSIEYTEDRFVCVCAHARSWVSLCVHERMEWGWRGQSSRLLALSISIFLLFCCFYFVLFWNKISHDLEITESDWLADHLNPGELLGISVMIIIPVSIVTIRWVQGILTHNLMIVKQTFYPLKYLPNTR